MKLARSLAFGLLLVVIGLSTISGVAQDSSPFIWMKDLSVGMEGIGKTTVSGDQIRIFQTRIVGLVDNPGDLNDFILVRSSGDAIRDAGGYAQGMSGSPIYINEKLVGAFFGAYAFDNSPSPIGLVRPIEVMLKLVDRIEKSVDERMAFIERDRWETPLTQEALENVRWEDGTSKNIEFVSAPPSLATREANPEAVYVVRTGTPIWISGVSGRALDWLSRGVSTSILEQNAQSFLPIESPTLTGRSFFDEMSRGFEQRYGAAVYPFSASTGESGQFALDFEAGRPMAALLTQGDITVGSICTTSYIDPVKNILLACGHQIFLTGGSNMFLAKARVLDTVSNAQISFVLPEVDTSQVFGTVMEDRVQAIGASLSYQDRPIRLTARAHDVTTDTTREINVSIARSDNLTATLAFTSLLQLVDDTLNRLGKGTMQVEYSIRGQGMGKRVARSDVFFSFNDIALSGPLQAAQVVLLIDQNEFVDPKIDWIDVDITLTDDVRWLDIKSIETDQEVYHPGDTVRYIIVLKSYRGEERRISGSFVIPDDTTARRLTLFGFGGPRRAQSSSQAQQVQFTNLDEILEAVEKVTRNDQITIELLGLPVDPEAPVQDPTLDVQQLGDWVVTGEERINIQIEPRPEPAPEEPGREEQAAQEEQPAGEEGDEGDSGDDDSDKEQESNQEEQAEGEEAPCAQLFYCE